MQRNIAYTEEYMREREKSDYLFVDKFMINECEVKKLKYKDHIVKSTSYCEICDSGYKCHNVLYAEVFNGEGNKVYEFKNIDYNTDLLIEIEHSNGHNYLIFSTDLYGYSVLNLDNYKDYHYMPENPKDGTDESFIWTDVKYCKRNNIIAVEGCIWACPFGTFFYDFSIPEELPHDLIYSIYDMDGEINIDTDAIPLYWNEDGTIVLKCCIGEDEKEIEKTIDIISRRKK